MPRSSKSKAPPRETRIWPAPAPLVPPRPRPAAGRLLATLAAVAVLYMRFTGGTTLPPNFVLFEPDHLATIALTLAGPLVLALLSRGGRRIALDTGIRPTFAALLIATWIGWYVLFIARGWLTWGNVLPMNLCDWATIATIAACFGRSQKAYELAYFWSLAGTLRGLITPDVNYPFPEPQFVVFMLGHALIIARLQK